MPQLRDRVAVTVMAYAGLRPGEMLALRWDAVGEHLILVDRSWSYNEQRDTKTGRARTVELVGPLREDLDALRPGRAEPGALVVPSETGGYVDLHNWRRRVWTTACAAAGVKAAPYDCRHTYASLLIHEGRSLPFVSASMSTATTVLEHYAHAFEQARLGDGGEHGRRDRGCAGGCAQSVRRR